MGPGGGEIRGCRQKRLVVRETAINSETAGGSSKGQEKPVGRQGGDAGGDPWKNFVGIFHLLALAKNRTKGKPIQRSKESHTNATRTIRKTLQKRETNLVHGQVEQEGMKVL